MPSIGVRARDYEKKVWCLTAEKYGKDISSVVRDVMNALALGRIQYPSPILQQEIRDLAEENQ